MKIKTFKGLRLLKIGRFIIDDIYDKNVSFNDYDGEIFLEFEKNHIIILKPYPTTEGDKIIIKEKLNYKSDEKKVFVTFKSKIDFFLPKLIDVKLNLKDSLIKEIIFNFHCFKLVISISNSDELLLNYSVG